MNIKYIITLCCIYSVFLATAIADEIPKLPDGWDSCQKSEDCVVILGPCDTARAANRTHEEAVRKQTETIILVTTCTKLVESTSKEEDFLATCRGGKCMAQRKPRQIPKAIKPSTKLKPTESSSSSGKLTAKQAQELNRFKKRELLINPPQVMPGSPNRFDKDTLYVMNNFKIIQKIQGGYLVLPNLEPGHTIEFGVAFLNTQKKLTPDMLISGAVYYAGEYKYNGMNGFAQTAPILKSAAELPFAVIRQGKDPFAPEHL